VSGTLDANRLIEIPQANVNFVSSVGETYMVFSSPCFEQKIQRT
jgi:hypothetical protein